MNTVLVLGAGLVCRPLVRYLLDRGFSVTVASRTVSKAEALIAGHPRGRAVAAVAEETAKIDRLVGEHDLSVSLLPAPLHPVVAELCLKHKKHMVTTSYVSPKMRALDSAARAAGLTIMNEIGVDPGIDHMSAMRIIDDVKRRGGRVVSFKSDCGGLPAPDSNNNPFGYKFSWSPRGVCTAGKNSAVYRQGGKEVSVPGPDLFTHYHTFHVEGIGDLEAYPNRDSLSYIDVYGLTDIETMLRGTYRYPGWCDTLKKIVDLGLLDETPTTYPAGTTYAQFTARFLKCKPSGHLRRDVASQLKLPESSAILERFEWLGLFSDEPIPPAGVPTTPLDVLAVRMEQKMKYAPGERDMIVVRHEFIARFRAGKDEAITSTLIDFGRPDGDTSMARTVSLPAAIGVRLILTGKIQRRGVCVPVTPDLYNPILDELAELGIRMKETTAPLPS